MAKAKTFNITNFMEDAAEGVMVADQQKKKEVLEKIQEQKTPETQPSTQNTYPTEQEGRGVAKVAEPEEPQKGKRGRKKSLRTIERVNGKIVFLEKSMDVDLAKLSTFERFDKQDIIRTALFQWLQQHFDGMMLDNDGRRQVIEYIQRTTTFEDI